MKSDKPLPFNDGVSRQLRERIASAAKPPQPRAVPAAPALERRISGNVFKLPSNTLALETLALHFSGLTTAQAELALMNHRLHFPIGLDGVERFSLNPITGLPHAAKGGWLSEHTFRLELNLVGAINCYRLELTSSEDGKSLRASLTERTGLNDEQFEGVRSH